MPLNEVTIGGGMTRQRYPEIFKSEAVKQTTERGRWWWMFSVPAGLLP